MIPNEDDEEAAPFRNEITYLHGVLYLDNLGTPTAPAKWVFESYKHHYEAKNEADVAGKIAELYSRGLAEFTDQQRQLEEAGSALKKSLEEKKQ